MILHLIYLEVAWDIINYSFQRYHYTSYHLILTTCNPFRTLCSFVFGECMTIFLSSIQRINTGMNDVVCQIKHEYRLSNRHNQKYVIIILFWKTKLINGANLFLYWWTVVYLYYMTSKRFTVYLKCNVKTWISKK